MASHTHKWTIENFRHFYSGKCELNCVESSRFAFDSRFQLHLSLYPHGFKEKNRDYLSLYLVHSSDVDVDVKIKYKISILHRSGDACNSKGGQRNFIGTKDNWGFGNYVSIERLLDKSNGLVNADKLVIKSEVQEIQENDEIKSESNENFQSESYFNPKLRVHDSLFHKWTIDYFEHLYKDKTWKPTSIDSKVFSTPNRQNNFFISLYPNGNVNEKETENTSIYLNYSSELMIEQIIRYSISIFDQNGEKRFYKENQEKIVNKKKEEFFGSAYLTDHLLDPRKELMSGEKLIVFCEIQIIESNIRLNSLIKPVIEISTKTNLSESYLNANARVVDSFTHKWTIDIFRLFYKNNNKIHENLNSIETKKFCSNQDEHQFSLILDPIKVYDDEKEYISVYLNYFSAQENTVDGVPIRFRMSVMDRKDEKRHTAVTRHLYCENESGWGCKNFVDLNKLLDKTNDLLQDGEKLVIWCEAQVLDDSRSEPESTKTTKENSSSIHESYSTANPQQINHLTHRWTIDNLQSFLKKQ